MRLHTTILGSGPPLIFLHGLFGRGENWLTIAKTFAPYYTVYLPDLRNHGQSFHANSHNYTDLSDDLYLWCEQNQITQSALIGHSMGGKVAMTFTLRHPELVNRLVVVDMTPINYNNSYTDELKQSIAIMCELDLTHFTNREQILSTLREKLKNRRMVGFFIKNIKKDKNNRFYWQCNLAVFQQNVHVIRDSLEAYRPSSPCKIPTLFLYGSDSEYTVSSFQRESKKYFSHSLFVPIKKAGHWVHSDQPNDFCRIVALFLNEDPL